MNNLIKVLCLVTIAFTWACTSPEPPVEAVAEEPVDMTEQTTTIVNRHLEAFGNHDLETLLSDYSDESIIMTNDKDYKGLAEIQQVSLDEDYTNFDASFSTVGREFKVNNVCPFKLQGLQTFNDHRTYFNSEFPINEVVENYRYIERCMYIIEAYPGSDIQVRWSVTFNKIANAPLLALSSMYFD